MFVDNIKIVASSGKGGAGCASFHREKFIIKGGPDGGDGGKGGDVYVLADKNTHTLSHFKGHKHIKAKNGMPGKSRNMTGKSGEDAYIIVPPGTQIFDNETDELLADMVKDGEKVRLLKGGKGGLGNVHFKSATNQRPTYAQPGLPGETKELRLELKLIADVGLVGFPNVGKSTLISMISNASPEIANYEFTTLTPKLGVVALNDYSSFMMADIPGIIEGASDGKGLGLEFLQHIERTKTLLFIIDMANYRETLEQYNILKEELSLLIENEKKIDHLQDVKSNVEILKQRNLMVSKDISDALANTLFNFQSIPASPLENDAFIKDLTIKTKVKSDDELYNFLYQFKQKELKEF